MADSRKTNRYTEIAAKLEQRSREKVQVNVAVDKEVADRLNAYVKEKDVVKGDVVTAAVELFLEGIGR